MKFSVNFLLSTALLTASFAASAATPAKIEPKGKETAVVPAGYVLLPEPALVYLQDTPPALIDSARQLFHEKKHGAAAMDLGQAAVLLKLEAKRAPKEERDLDGAADRLLAFAHKVERGEVKSEEEFRVGIAEVFVYAAKHHRLRAIEEWSVRQTRAAGHDLRAAADATERAAIWTGHQIQDGTTAAVKAARDAAGKLVEGAGWAKDKVASAMDSLGKEVELLWKKMDTEKSPR